MSKRETLAEFLSRHGFPSYPNDGQWHRFSLDGSGKPNCYYNGVEFEISGQKIVSVLIGDWGRGFEARWQDEPGAMGEGERAEFERQLEEQREILRRERTAKWEEVAAEAEAQWAAAYEMGLTPYMERKGIDQLYGARICSHHPDTLLVPLRDVEGKLWSLQRILPRKLDNGLDKLLMKGGRKRGCFHLIGEAYPKGKLLVCEGYATGASLHMATGLTVAVAIDSGNLPSVVHALGEKYPEAEILVCADNDQWTTKKVDGKEVKWNPGKEAAQEAVSAARPGVTYIVPRFASLDGRPTDFNDLAMREGLAVVKEQVMAPVMTEVNKGALFGDLAPLSPRVNKQGNLQAPGEQRVVEYLLEHFQGDLVKQDRDLFRYVGTHWKLLTLGEQDRLKVFIQQVCGGLANVKHIDACYRLLVYSLPSVPDGVDLFTPNPFCANFLNGTLHLERQGGSKYSLVFREHRREDWLVNVLPFEYREKYEENHEFLKMLDRVFEGNEDKEEKIRAVKQMYGACLVPRFPHLFMLYGPAGTGKSTVLKIASKLVHEDNLSKVAPSDFVGFNMESMAGKLVNLDTDIPFDAPIRDEIVKKIIDRQSFRIRRKGIKDIYAPIPSVHLFGGNDIPRALDGASRAHDRRWSFIEFNAFVPKGNYDQDFHDWVFEQGPEGILGFALEGLRDLCESGGHFVNPASGKAAMDRWQLRSDIVGTFLKDVEEGEVITDNSTRLILSPEAQIERAKAWSIFQKWAHDSYNRQSWLGKHAFFDALRKRNFREVTIRGVRYWRGFGVLVDPGAKY